MTAEQRNLITKEELENETRRKFIKDKHNATMLWDEFAVGKETDNEANDSERFMKELKKVGLNAIHKAFEDGKVDEYIPFDEWYHLVYNEKSPDQLAKEMYHFRNDISKAQKSELRAESKRRAADKKRLLEEKKRKRRLSRKKVALTKEQLADKKLYKHLSNIAFAKEAFNYFDKDHSNYLDMKEFKAAVTALGSKMGDIKAATIGGKKQDFDMKKFNKLMFRTDDNRGGTIDFIEFCYGIYGKPCPSFDISKIKLYISDKSYAQLLFDLFDTDKNDFLNPHDLQNFLEYAAEKMVESVGSKKTEPVKLPWPQKGLEKRIKEIDENNDNKIDFKEFCELIWPTKKSVSLAKAENKVSDHSNKQK